MQIDPAAHPARQMRAAILLKTAQHERAANCLVAFFFAFKRWAHVFDTAPITGSEGLEVLARAIKRHRIGTALKQGIIELKGIVFPVAYRADGKRAGRLFAQRCVAAARARIFFRVFDHYLHQSTGG